MRALMLAAVLVAGCNAQPGATADVAELKDRPAALLGARNSDVADLPAPVRAAFDRLQSIAAARDVAGLTAYAAQNPNFQSNFGGEADAGAYWEAMKRNGGGDVTLELAKILAQPFGVERLNNQPIYVWPSVYLYEPEGAMSAQTIADFKALGYPTPAAGEAYFGWRVGIDGDGKLQFLVSGD